MTDTITEQTPDLRKTLLTLPPEVSSAFARLSNSDQRNAYASTLRGLGWTLQSISAASGLTRERVRQIVEETDLTDSDWSLSALPLPTPPAKPVKVPRVYVEPDAVKLARLLELQPLAQSVRSNSPLNRAEAEEYTALVAEVHLKDGVPLYRLAKRLGVTHGALRFRLARYGYKMPEGGTSKVYTPILEANRAN